MSDRLPVQPRKSRKLSLKFILIGQFAILIVGISGLMAWLSWRSEQEMIANLVRRRYSISETPVMKSIETFMMFDLPETPIEP